MKRYELDGAQQTEIERAFLEAPPRDGHQQKFEMMNEKIQQTAKFCFSLTPKCPEQTLALRKLQEAQHWFVAAIKKNEL